VFKMAKRNTIQVPYQEEYYKEYKALGGKKSKKEYFENLDIFIDETLGDTMDDAVVYLKDKKNSGKLTILRAKLKELSLV